MVTSLEERKECNVSLIVLLGKKKIYKKSKENHVRSVTAEYVLISWHIGEQNTDLLLGPGRKENEMDLLETKVVCSSPPFTPNGWRVLMRKPR